MRASSPRTFTGIVLPPRAMNAWVSSPMRIAEREKYFLPPGGVVNRSSHPAAPAIISAVSQTSRSAFPARSFSTATAAFHRGRIAAWQAQLSPSTVLSENFRNLHGQSRAAGRDAYRILLLPWALRSIACAAGADGVLVGSLHRSAGRRTTCSICSLRHSWRPSTRCHGELVR